ncbi:hypothetical protein [Gymnodinialimonas sp. 57CJ19]|uniref:hypothetical protein n=1 Tax=Gymnodinialimonas sp. 57CJ19 TaxID=3138498 RepID=UPI0031342FF8
MLLSVQHNDTRTHSPSILKALANRSLSLPEADYLKLQEHLEAFEGTSHRGATLLRYVLANKLMNARPAVDMSDRDVVVGGSLVTYAIDSGASYMGLLTHRARAGASSGVIPVASLLGATLIGMRKGERAALLCEDGSIARLRVTYVNQSV